MRKLLLLFAFLFFAPAPADAVVRVSQRQGFDKCFVPTVGQMQRWWDSSPYWNVNVYIGGSSRACAQANLTSSWVSAVHQQGWNFIPTWVGPQAPCTNYPSRHSWTISTARGQGAAEADKAIAAAAALGFTSPMIIYYDMEGYPDNTACYNAVNAFMDGWGARMRARGHRAGGYGSACASGMQAWGDIANWPHSVWLAHWLYASYRSTANVWNVACVPNSYWQDHQRIRQYAGDHNETWGGVLFNIDSNALDGLVQGSNNHGALVAQSAPAPAPHQTHAFATLPRGDLQAVHGDWIATTTPPDAAGEFTLAIHTTSDRGATWRSSTVHTFRIADGDLLAGPIWVDTMPGADGRTVYVAARLASSANFSRGVLFGSSDGGVTWTQRTLPIGAAARFVDALTGWTAGGAGGDELHVTYNGGMTWSAVDLGIDEPAFMATPTFTSERDGVLPVTIASPTQPRVAIYTTEDQGTTWTLSHAVPLTNEPAARVPVAIADATTWIVIDPATDVAHLTGPNKQVASTMWPAGVVEIAFTSALAGQVERAAGTCTGSKAAGTLDCTQDRRIMKTEDGGRTWRSESPADDDPVIDDEPTMKPGESSGCNAMGGTGGIVLMLIGYLALVLARRMMRRPLR